MPLILATEYSFFQDILRNISAFLDNIFYSIVSVLMQAVFDISNFTLDAGLFDAIIHKIYLVLSIFMLFKLTISFLSYLVNPEKMNDKENGVGKVITRVILVLIMLLILPSGFELLVKVQNALLPSLPRVILGVSTYSANGNNDLADNMDSEGNYISWQVYQAFFYPNSSCPNVIEPDSFLDRNGINNVEEATANINVRCDDNTKIYLYDYRPGISFLAGGFMAYVMLGICITVAVRMFKLLILQMIAPIPVISYIDPKSSKDGAFKSWTKALTETWLELFIQLGILYLIIAIVDVLLKGGVFQETVTYLNGKTASRGLFFLVFVIMGLFMFAKQAPKFIIDSLGIKSKGTFAKAMGLAATAIKTPGAVIAGTRASMMSDEANHKFPNIIKNVGAGLFSGITAAGAAGSAVMTSEKDFSKASRDAMIKHNATTLARGASGSTVLGRAGNNISGFFLGESLYDIDQRKIKGLESTVQTGKQLQNYLEDRAVKKGSTLTISNFRFKDDAGIEHEADSTNLNEFLSAWNLAKQRGNETFEFGGATLDTFGAAAAAIEGDIKAAAGQVWAKSSEGQSDITLRTYQEAYRQNGGTADVTNSDAVKKEWRTAEQEAFGMKNSPRVHKHEINSGKSGSNK